MRLRAAQDLTAIAELSDWLQEQAENTSNHRLMPGGRAMVSLAQVANREAWQHRVDTDIRLGRATDYVGDEDRGWEPPLQTLRRWSDRWRREHGAEYEMAHTIASETGFLRWCLEWAEDQPGWKAFCKDMTSARARLEDTVQSGLRSERGVPCFDCNEDLVREMGDRREPRFCAGGGGICTWPHERCPLHDRGGLSDEWVCPACYRKYDEDSYRRAVAYLHHLYADYLPLHECMERTGVPRGSIQGWASRGQIARKKDFTTGRTLYSVTDVAERAA